MVGRINQPCIGYVEEPDIDAFHYVDGPKQPTYRVTFHQKDLWEGYQVSSPLCGARLILERLYTFTHQCTWPSLLASTSSAAFPWQQESVRGDQSPSGFYLMSTPLRECPLGPWKEAVAPHRVRSVVGKGEALVCRALTMTPWTLRSGSHGCCPPLKPSSSTSRRTGDVLAEGPVVGFLWLLWCISVGLHAAQCTGGIPTNRAPCECKCMRSVIPTRAHVQGQADISR